MRERHQQKEEIAKTVRLEVKTEVLPTLQFCLELYLITIRLITSGPA